MKFILYLYLCGRCNQYFKAPSLLNELYGEFILRSQQNDEIVYLNSFQDTIFEELEHLFQEDESIKKTNNANNTELFHKVFSISCDIASDGTIYQIGALPHCPNCGLKNILTWKPTNPPEYFEKDIKAVSHKSWNKLSLIEKKILINQAINKYLKQ